MVDQRANRRGRTEAPQAAELEPRCEEEKAVDIAGNYSLDVFSARSSFRRFASLRARSVADWARHGATLLTRYFHLVGLWLVGGFSARLFLFLGGLPQRSCVTFQVVGGGGQATYAPRPRSSAACSLRASETYLLLQFYNLL